MIQVPDTGFTPGTIVLAAGGQPRHHEFQESLAKVFVPNGTMLQIITSCDVANNFNKGVRAATGDWVWFLGDDHAFAPDTLMRLLNYNVDVVVPVSPCKTPFAYPFVLHGRGDGWWYIDLQTYSWAELNKQPLFVLPKGDFIGQAGMLVTKSVLDKIGDPWFKCGKFNEGRLQEDVWFCKELQESGCTVHVATEIILDHYWFMAVSAKRINGRWVPSLKAAGFEVVLPDL